MPHPEFYREALKFKPLSERQDRVFIEQDHVPPDASPRILSKGNETVITETVRRIIAAREAGKPRMLAFGAHTIKNGLAPVLIQLIENGWVTHLATNGAGIIHDWEFAYQGHSSEHVGENVAKGQFGLWEETGYYLNLAINLGAYSGLGYGESVGGMVEEEGLDIPSEEQLRAEIDSALDKNNASEAAATADLLHIVRKFGLATGRMVVKHPYKRFGLQAAAFRLGVPFTGHPMVGQDIIYTHPMNHIAALGRTAQYDFLTFSEGVSRLDGGVYLSVGSAIMSPMLFEKSFSMAQNIAIQRGEHIDRHFVVVVDLHPSNWDWGRGEPPEDHPDYYLRFNKTFSRMGGEMRYMSSDNRDFLLALMHGLGRG